MRTHSASHLIAAPPEAIYRAFAEPGAMERWLPPNGMTGRMLHFDFREGGSYRMRLTYLDPEPRHGKTTDDADEVDVRLTKLDGGRLIEQEAVFDSDDPAFAGTMRITWTFEPHPSDEHANRTLVTVRAENVPEGIRRVDHETAQRSSLEKLAGFVKENA